MATLKTHLIDYDALQIKFFQQGKLITLQGEPGLLPLEVQFYHIRLLYHTRAIVKAYTMHFTPIDITPKHVLDLPQDMESKLALLLDTYKEDFQKPLALPPPRLHD